MEKKINTKSSYRTLVSFTEEQKEKIHKYCADTGVPMASLVKSLIDEFFRKREEQ